MFQKLIHFLSFLMLLFLCSEVLVSQEKKLTKKEITQLADEANNLMKAGFYEKSLVQSRIALHHSYSINDDNLIATCYKTIAANVDELNEPEKALFYYRKSLKFANKTTNDNLKNKLNNNLGNIYCFDKKLLDKGIQFYNKSIEYSKKIKDTTQIVFTKLNMTWAYFDYEKFKEGFPHLKFINKFHSKYGDKTTIVALNMLNGMYYNHINENEKSRAYFIKAIELGENGDEKSDLSFACHEYSKLLLKIGDYKNAYKNLAIYSKISEKLYNEEILTTTNIAGINLELDETKREIKRVENGYKLKQQLQEEKESKKQKIFLIIIGLLTLTGVLLYFFFQNSRLKQKNNLNEVKNKLHQKIINANIDGQELERKKIASFLHDNISAKLSSAGLHLFAFSAVNNIDSEEITKTKSILKEVHDEIRNLSHELLPVLLSKFGLFYAVQDLCEKNSNAILKFEYSSNIPIETRYNEEYEMKIYFIITELFNNILKYSQASKAKITFQEKGKILIIDIEDNGKGFTTNEGYGLTQIRARVLSMNGLFSINSISNAGTFIQIKLPIQ